MRTASRLAFFTAEIRMTRYPEKSVQMHGLIAGKRRNMKFKNKLFALAQMKS